MWQTELIELVRGLIFDLGDSPDFTDEQLTRVIMVSASLVSKSANFTNNFKVDISEQTISPDPSASDTKDVDFLNLTALRAACMLDIGKARIESANSISIKDDKNSVNMSNLGNNYLRILELGYCKIYEQSVREYKFDGGSFTAEGILSPFRNRLRSQRSTFDFTKA